MEKVERIERLISNVRKPARLSIERAKLYTESMKRTEGEPMIIRQAKALKHVLENIPIQILDGELIVGTMLPNSPGAILFPEGVGLRLINDLDTLPSRDTNRLNVSEEDAEVFLNDIAPYWQNRTIEAFAAHARNNGKSCIQVLFSFSQKWLEYRMWPLTTLTS